MRERCPKAGFVELDSGVRTYTARTACKSWSCRVCRTKLLSLVQMKAEYGCLILGDCYFITLTLRAIPHEETKDAAYVRGAWERFLKALRLGPYPEIAWMKIPELTKREQPHLHLLVGGVGKPTAMCQKNPKFIKWIRNEEGCECLAHVVGAAWFEQTGAYVVDVREIYNPSGLSRYLGKYLTKSFSIRERMANKGFLRRYSSSRNWPKAAQLRLAGTDRGWKKVTIVREQGNLRRYYDEKVEVDAKSPLMGRVGDDLSLALIERKGIAGKKKGLREVERLINVDKRVS